MSAVDVSPAVDRLLEAFTTCYDDTRDVIVVQAPGRVNLIGDHTDYNDGFVFPMTIDRAVYVALRRRDDDRVRVLSQNFDDAVDYRLAERPEVPASAWSSYVTGVVEELRRRDLLPSGFEAVLYGDVPLGAGLSSSAALEVAVAVALQELFGFALDPVATARLCQQVEHRYAGVQCGIMDQFASRLGREGHALFLDCRSLDYENVPLPLADAGLALVIADTRMSRELAGSKYNERRAECDAALRHFQQYDGTHQALRDVSPSLMRQYGDGLDPVLYRRARHVVEENQRVCNAVERLRADDYAGFGRLMSASHASLRDLYEVSSPALDRLVEIAEGTEGVLGARMTGAGFGGCTVILAAQDAVPALRERLHAGYTATFDRAPAVYVLETNFQAGRVEVEG